MFNVGDRVKYRGNGSGLYLSQQLLGCVGTVIGRPVKAHGGTYVVVKWDGGVPCSTSSPYIHNLQLISEEKKQMNEIDTTTIEGKIAVMQAFKEGKAIEFRAHGYSESWRPVDQNPVWNWGRYDYRIKKEPEVRWLRRYKSGRLGDVAFLPKEKSSCSPAFDYTWVKFVEAEGQE